MNDVVHWMPALGPFIACRKIDSGELISLTMNPSLVNCKVCLKRLKDQVVEALNAAKDP